MIQKQQLTTVINKYYLNTHEAVKWVIENNTLEVDFMSPTKDVIGKITSKNFDLDDGVLPIYETKKLSNLIGITYGELVLEVTKTNQIATQLKISDPKYNLTYNLADVLLIPKVGTVNAPEEWDIEIDFEKEDILNLVKAKSALADTNHMNITSIHNLDGELICEVVFGEGYTHSNKITYQMEGKVSSGNINIPFNSEMFKMILNVNKDMETGTLKLNSKGLLHLQFQTETTTSEYFMIRTAEADF